MVATITLLLAIVASAFVGHVFAQQRFLSTPTATKHATIGLPGAALPSEAWKPLPPY
jgi:hypothetical protein